MESKAKNFLVVDDSRAIRKIVSQMLKKMQFDVSEAEDGAVALDMCRAGMPDAILLDWNMPNMDGIEFLRALRHTQGGDRPVVVVCTSENDMSFIAAAIEAGANEYIMKPFDQEIFASKLSQVGLVESGYGL